MLQAEHAEFAKGQRSEKLTTHFPLIYKHAEL